MRTVGPYTFSEEDARKTVQHLDDLWQLLTDGRDAAAIAHLRPAIVGDLDVDLPAVWDALQAAGPALREAGQLPVTTTGEVVGLFTSDGGVPKLPVPQVEVDHSGVAGDRQGNRIHHGRPWQALCLWSAEVIDAFAAEGHPLAPGNAGENITVRGLPWRDVRPGVRLRIGTVLCEASAYAVPCRHNARWFSDGDFSRIHHSRGPVSRVYATVLEHGSISLGDAAILEP
jgi:MOSC domain-containing protein YiiM